MSDDALSPSDRKHIREAWIWAAVIIGLGMLCALVGLLVQVANQGSADFEVSRYLP
jgi:hypothetical protein